MEYRLMGRTGVEVSPMALGCMMFGDRTTPEDSYAIIDRALDAGINLLDTSNSYGRGRSEEVTGDALKRNGRRDQVILATKYYIRIGEGPNMMGSSRRFIIEQCEKSLRRLKTDYIDLYQQHRPNPNTPIDETLRALDDLVTSGKVRYIGTSTFAAWQVMEALWTSDRQRLNRFVTEQPPYNIFERRIERELIPMAQTYGLAVLPWSPLAAGLLSGKYGHGKAPHPDEARYARWPGNPLEKARWVQPVYDAVEKLAALAEAKGCTLSQFALAWVMGQPGVTSAIIGPRTMEQLEDNLKALEVSITDEDRKAVDRIVPRGGMVVPYYEAEFGPHPHRI
ncbi:aldo/keto reductase [Sphingobium sp. Sx8-8]|uniref:aldo/keto reductase n=1 Tax=Sphingobium sp. Sx8-8 TaxID=2933617 RepID=UPI001F5AE17C|nr:aldo/keto reductase [Sphingobium sp. Sx8-8]